MPKILITSATLVNFQDEKGGQHVDEAEIVTVSKGTAAELVAAERGLYVSKSDDPSRGGINTAPEPLLKAAERARALRAGKGGKAVKEPAPLKADKGDDDTTPPAA